MKPILRILVLTVVATAGVAWADAAGKAGYTTRGCASCHSGSATSSSVTVSVTGPASLAVGAQGTYTLTVSGPPGSRAGFNLGTSGGTLGVVSTGTKLSGAELVQSAATVMTNSSVAYQFRLTAPATAGTVTLRYVGLSCNGDRGDGGDKEKLGTFAVTITAAAGTNAAPTVASAAAASPASVTGTTSTLSVLGADDGGETALTYTWARVTGPGTVTFNRNGTNLAKSVTATFGAAGAYSLSATVKDAAGLTATSTVSVNVSPSLTALVLSPASGTAAAGSSLQFSAAARDQFGAALATPAGLTWAVSGGGTISTSGLFRAGTSPGGPYTVTATSGAVSGSATVTVGASAAPTVATAAAASPTTVSATSTALSVLGASAAGEPGLTYTWTSSGPAPVTFSPNGSNAAKASSATFRAAGAYTLTVTIADASGGKVTSAVSVNVQQTLGAVSVVPASVSVAVGTTQSFSATAADQFGATLASQPTFTWSASGGGTLSSGGTFTASSTPGGPHTVTATSGTVRGTASVMVTAGSPPSVVNAAAASPTQVTGKTTALSVLGADATGESSLRYTWSKASGPGTVTFVPNGTNAAKASTATFSSPGSYTLSVTVTNGAGLTNSSAVSVTVASTLTSMAVSPSTVSLSAGSTQQFSASGVDQFGAALTGGLSPTWTVSGGGTVSADGLFTAGTSAGGPYTVRAASSGVSGTASVTVTALSPPSVASAARAQPSTVTGTTTQLSVLGADAAGEDTLTYQWTCPGCPAPVTYSANAMNASKTVTATFAQDGVYPFTVTLTNARGLSTTSAVTVTVVSTVASVSVAPPTATLTPGTTQQFTASAVDQFGAAPAAPPATTWSIASGCSGCSVSAGGLLTAGSSAGGPYLLRASIGGKSASAEVSIVQGSPPTMPQPPFASPNPVIGTSAELSVMGDDAAGEAALVYTWSVSPEGPVFSTNGSNAAKNTTVTFMQPGDYTFSVTVKNPSGLTVSASEVVRVAVAVMALNITPPVVRVPLFRAQAFGVEASDQFGHLVAPTPLVKWTATGAGSIDGQGVFTAGGVPGPARIQAAAGGVTVLHDIAVVDNDQDTTAPTVSLLSPSNGASISGALLLRAGAVDRGGIARVVFRIDGAAVGELTAPPWELRLHSDELGGGSHAVDVQAWDSAGNQATSDPANIETAGEGGVAGGCSATRGSLPLPIGLWLLGLITFACRRRRS